MVPSRSSSDRARTCPEGGGLVRRERAGDRVVGPQGPGALGEFEGAGFEGATDFCSLGSNITVLGPGEPLALYHDEHDQAGFSRSPARRWLSSKARSARYAGGTSCTVLPARITRSSAPERVWLALAVGARDRSTGRTGALHVDETAQRHGAGVDEETSRRGQGPCPFGKQRADPVPRGLAAVAI